MPSCIGKLQVLGYVSKLTLDHAMRRSLDALPPVFPNKVTEPALLGRLLTPVGNPLFTQGPRAWLITRIKTRVKEKLPQSLEVEKGKPLFVS